MIILRTKLNPDCYRGKLRHTSSCFSLQKRCNELVELSSFLADAPQEIEYLVDYKFLDNEI